MKKYRIKTQKSNQIRHAMFLCSYALCSCGHLKKQSQFGAARNDVKSYLKGYYGKKPPCGARKNKANSKPIYLAHSIAGGRKASLKKQSQFIRSECCVMRTAKRILKKQSQFVPDNKSVKLYIKGGYINIPALRCTRKQSQFLYRQPDSSVIITALCQKDD